jgi:hypothetical protein
MMGAHPEYSFVFVCQRGPLEIQAMLLAASLHRFVSCPHEMVIAVPQPESRYGTPQSSTLKMLQDLGARVAPVWNQVDPSYPIANKISAMAISTRGRWRIFLDTDILCTRPFSGDARLDVAFGATPADRLTWGKHSGDWDRVYELFGLTTPAIRVKTVSTHEDTPPYYNAGFVIAEREVADALSRVWLECAQVIDRHPAIPDKRPWLDQIALPVAVTRLGVPHHFLDQTFNCPGSAKSLSADTHFCHYHRLLPLKRLPILNQLLRELVEHHPALEQRVMSDRLWRDTLSPGFGLLDGLQTLKSVRLRVAPHGSRREQVASTLATGMRKLALSLRALGE